MALPGIAAARSRSDAVDALIAELISRLPPRVAAVALGAYGRRELTPRGDVDLLLLHDGGLGPSDVAETISYPLWERAIRVEPFVRTSEESENDARHSWSAAMRFLDARQITGDGALFEDFERRMQQWRRDRERLRQRVRSDAHHRHTSHPPATASRSPDLIAGRGGLQDINALRWLGGDVPTPTIKALDFLLSTIERVEELTGHTPHRLSGRVVERLDEHFLEELYAHTRWVAFSLDSALNPDRDDRQLGSNLVLHRGELTADRAPPLERAPSFGLRVANLVGLAPPSKDLLDWARSGAKTPLVWDESTREHFWRFLRAADWRAWDFLDVAGLLPQYVPELESIWRRAGSSATGDLAPDYHSFLSLRRLHEWTESDDPLARRIWRWLRHRDWAYLAVLLHELVPEQAAAAVERIGAPVIRETVYTAGATYQVVLDTATRRDLHDEDLLLELATRIGSRQRLSVVFLVAVAHEMASGGSAWSPWKADLVRQLFGQLESAFGQAREVGARRARSLEQHRERIRRELEQRGLLRLESTIARLPRRYVLGQSPKLAAQHLALLERAPLREGEVRLEAYQRRQAALWDVLIVARDRPGLLATVTGVLALRGASVLSADAATSSDGLVLDVFTVNGADTLQWSHVETDLRLATEGRIPLRDLLGSRPMLSEDADAIHVAADNGGSAFFTLIEVRAPDQVGLLYRIASALHAEDLDIHHARIATYVEGALDVFYVRDLAGAKLEDERARRAATRVEARLRGDR